MKCPKCGSEDVRIELVTEAELKNKHHSFLWWLFVGFWWVPIKWLVFTLPAAIIAIFKPKKQKLVSHQKKVCVCQTCGNSWDLK
jgi:Zn finger protein HypA/HybF involved in hydrogenase expression